MNYRGRFAPSPTGPLHFGSLVAALASWLDARAVRGSWVVRIEDLDAPRNVPGAADAILHTLEAFGLRWDEEVVYQSARIDRYRSALDRLRAEGSAFGCGCTRAEIASRALEGIDGPVYPGTCRNGVPAGRRARAWRARVDARELAFDDRVQGRIAQHLQRDLGDFVVLRADGVFAYQLAVVVDDAAQGITDIVRGADLLDSTPRQTWLRQRLALPEPRHAHVPAATDRAGLKLSKQTHAAPVDARDAMACLLRALAFLGQPAPAPGAAGSVGDLLTHARENWRIESVPRLRRYWLPDATTAASTSDRAARA
ncbi:MAG: tRNA glutamyl-Q(34) synthetase GluQRS [Proteobacteria bacterium]|nr:tRNA glutamyl-Q(34) synthetase GluQRS [Burkholderiales bacterium]